jgi:ABC-type phosphate/phosphonate transport system substrate-binding protein
MQAFKNAFYIFDKETCKNLSVLISPEDLVSIRPVSLSDYKTIMELLEERKQLINFQG